MKLLTVAIPCYNSSAYMEKAIESALTGGSSVEILIVDDGSSDNTGIIADAFARKYPDMIRAIHQPNLGHGGAVMAGLGQASGLYFKVLDSDDWLDGKHFPELVKLLHTINRPDSQVDMIISNYVYEKAGASHKHVVSFANALPEGRAFGWKETGRFRQGQYLLMHSVIYRTQLLRDSGLKLPEHTFYVDNLYVYEPMPLVNRMVYFNEVIYHYFIGRDDQSVHESVMLRRIDQQLRVNNRMMDNVNLSALHNRAVKRYLRNYLEIITAVSSVLLIRSGTEEHLAMKKKLWSDMKRRHPDIYRMLRWRPMGIALHLPGRMGRGFVLSIYRITQKIYGFN